MNSPPNGRRSFALFAAAGYALVLSLAACHHVVWRDEVRAFSIATSSSSLGNLFSSLKNEGHPALWYLLLRTAFFATGSALVLKAVSLAAAVAGLYVFARCAPYTKVEVLLWALGILPLHEYSVVCRNYSLVLPLVFGYCALYARRREHPWAAGLLLALLANTAAYGAVLAAGFLAAEASLALATRRAGSRPFLVTAGLALLGIAAAALTMVPDQTTVVTPLYVLKPAYVLAQVGRALVSQGGVASGLFSLPWGVPVSAVVLLWYLFLGRRLHLSLFVFTAVMGTELLGRLVYYPSLRHQGTVLVALVAAHWIASLGKAQGADGPSGSPTEPVPLAYADPALRRGTAVLARCVLVFLLLIQAYQGLSSAYQDYRRPDSSSKQWADYVLSRPDLRGAIILAEPDYMADAFPYYLDNRIFVAREGRFARWTSFTTKNRGALALGELLADARALRAHEKVPVLVVMGFDLGKPAMLKFSFGKVFWFDAKQLEDWNRDTTRLVTFNKADGDENYTLYLVGR